MISVRLNWGRHNTDIGAFIESSSVPSANGSMAPSIVSNDVVQGETFLPGQIFVFGGFVLRANSLGHLEQIRATPLAVRSGLEV